MSRFGHYESCGVCHSHPCACVKPFTDEEKMRFHREYLGNFKHVSSDSLIRSLREALEGNEQALDTLSWIADRLKTAERIASDVAWKESDGGFR